MTVPADQYKGWRGIKRAFATPSALTMLCLGFGSGLPFLLVGGTLSTWLRDTGVALSAIGLVSYASFFYVLEKESEILFSPPILYLKTDLILLTFCGLDEPEDENHI